MGQIEDRREDAVFHMSLSTGGMHQLGQPFGLSKGFYLQTIYQCKLEPLAGFNNNSIKRWFLHFGISRRSLSRPHGKHPELDSALDWGIEHLGSTGSGLIKSVV